MWLRPTDLVDQPTKPSSTNQIDLDIANRFHNAAYGETAAPVSPPAFSASARSSATCNPSERVAESVAIRVKHFGLGFKV